MLRALLLSTAMACCVLVPAGRTQTAEPAPATAPAPRPEPVLRTPAVADQTGSLEWAIAGPWRIEPERDRWRKPAETLRFFGVEPNMTVVEVWPGQGWYTAILGPWLREGRGRLIAAGFDPSSRSEFVQRAIAGYRQQFVEEPETYGRISVVGFGPGTGPIAPDGTVDAVLTFRNVHNWMAQGWAEKAFADFYKALKPGGILGIEEHRAAPGGEQDPLARDGYVQETYVIKLALEAGFELVDKSEINANPADTRNHPFGVWTLPPVRRSSPMGQPPNPSFDRSRYEAIGESDRMTLRFRKPFEAPREGPAALQPSPPAPPARTPAQTRPPAPPPQQQPSRSQTRTPPAETATPPAADTATASPPPPPPPRPERRPRSERPPAPPPPPPPPPPALQPARSGAFLVQLGAFPSEAAARDAWRDAERRNRSLFGPFEPRVVSTTSNGGTLYRLRTGPFANRADANQFCSRVGRATPGCFVVATGN